MELFAKGQNGQYPIRILRGGLSRAGEFFALDRRVMIVTDSGVPADYALTVCGLCREGHIFTLPRGEGSKSVGHWSSLLGRMLSLGFERGDCLVAVGGGVVGDLAGFAAGCYMRGIDFYNIPTTLLSQVDASVGGKCAVDMNGTKNPVGLFYPPKGVFIDPELLSTLSRRELLCGYAEALKMALTCDEELFEIFESGRADERTDEMIERALRIKIKITDEDEREAGLRRVLNFGHTLGHAIEAASPGLLHGECVALGMLPMCSPEVRKRLIAVLEKLGLPTRCTFDIEKAKAALAHDKKSGQSGVCCVRVDKIGSYAFENKTLEELSCMFDFYGDRI